jgi:hypothetical protein
MFAAESVNRKLESIARSCSCQTMHFIISGAGYALSARYTASFMKMYIFPDEKVFVRR